MPLNKANICRCLAATGAERDIDVVQQDAVVFHMTDWLDDLEALYRYYSDPEELSVDQAEDVLVSFLIHVPNHLAAAAKLLVDMPVSDIFDVGAVDMVLEEKVKQFRLRLVTWGNGKPEEPVYFPSDEQIAGALHTLDGEELFGASIGLHDNYYLLVNRCTDSEENRFDWVAGDLRHVCADANPALVDVTRAFQQFAKGDHSWKQDFDWRKV